MRKYALRILTAVLAVCLGVCLMAACTEEPAPATEYTLTYTANGGVGADVTEKHKEGDTVTVKGDDLFTWEGHTFTGWKEGETEIEAGSSYTMPAHDVTLSAQWQSNGEQPPVADKYNVTLKVNGAEAGNSAALDKSGKLEKGTTVKLTVNVASGYSVAVTVGGKAVTLEGNAYSFQVNADTEVVVTFTKNTQPPVAQKYNVTLKVNGGGNGNTAVLDKSGEVEKGTTVKLTVNTAENYDAAVTVGGQAVQLTGTEYSFQVNADTEVVVTFTEKAPVLDLEGIWTAKGLTVNFGAEMQADATITVKNHGADAIDVVLSFDIVTEEEVTEAEEELFVYCFAFRFPKMAEGKYGSAPNFTLELKEGKLEIVSTMFSSEKAETYTLETRAPLTGTAPAFTGLWRDGEGNEYDFRGTSPAFNVNGETYTPELVTVGKYLVAFSTTPNDDMPEGVSMAITVLSQEGSAYYAYLGEGPSPLTKVETYKNIVPTAKIEFYADDYFKLTVSKEDLDWIKAHVKSVKVNGEQYEHGAPAYRGFLPDGETQIQIHCEPGAQDNPKAEYVLDWYDAKGELVAKTTIHTQEEPPATYKVTVNAQNADVVFDQDGPYLTGVEVFFSIEPHDGYKVTSVKVGETDLYPNGAGKYTVTVESADIVVEVTVEEMGEEDLRPVITFAENGGSGSAPELNITADQYNGKYYALTLPENTYTAPANKYFRGWQVSEIVYFPGEELDVLPQASVTITAVWEERFSEAKTNGEAVVSRKWNASATNVVVYDGTTVKLVAEVTDSNPLSWHGLINDGVIVLNDLEYFAHFRVDGYVWTTGTNGGTSNDTEALKLGVADQTTFDGEKYVAMYAEGATTTHVITVSLNNNELLYTYETFSAYTEGGTNQPVSKAVWKANLTYPVGLITMKFMIDDGVNDPNAGSMAVKSAKVTYYDFAYSANQTPTEEDPIVIGAEGNTLLYTGNNPVWISNIRKGEKLTLKGTFTSPGTQNYFAPLMYLYDGAVPDFNIRADNFVNGCTNQEDPIVQPFHISCGWQITGNNEGSTVALIGDDWWAGARKIFTQADLEITYDYTGENILVIFKATGTAEGENQGKIFMYTYTVQKGTGTFADQLSVGLGGDHCYARITSLQRTSEKPQPEVPFYNGGEGDTKTHPDTWYWWTANGEGEWENGCVATMNNPSYDPLLNTISLNFTTEGGPCWYAVQLFYKNAKLTVGQVYRLTFTITFQGDEEEIYHVCVNGYDLTLHGGINHVEVVYTETDYNGDANGASFRMQFGWNGKNETMVTAAEAEISEWKWEEASLVTEALKNPTDFKLVTGENKVEFTDPNEKGVAGYKLAFHKTEDPAESPLETVLLHEDRSFDVPDTLPAGTYYLRLQAVNASYLGYQSPSGWTNPAVPYTISGGPVKGESMGTPSDKAIVNSGKSDDAKQDDGFMLWWVQGNDWNCGKKIDKFSPETVTDAYKDGKVSFSYEGGNVNYSVQLFYKNTQLQDGTQYFLTCTINLLEGDNIPVTLNGQQKTLKNGVNEIELIFTSDMNNADVNASVYGVDFQFPGTEFASVAKISVEISNVEWFEVDQSSEPQQPGQPVTPQPSQGTVHDVYNAALDPDIFVVWFRVDGYTQDALKAARLYINGTEYDAEPYEISPNDVEGQFQLKWNNIFAQLHDGDNTVEIVFNEHHWSPAVVGGGPQENGGKTYTMSVKDGKVTITVA